MLDLFEFPEGCLPLVGGERGESLVDFLESLMPAAIGGPAGGALAAGQSVRLRRLLLFERE